MNSVGPRRGVALSGQPLEPVFPRPPLLSQRFPAYGSDEVIYFQFGSEDMGAEEGIDIAVI